MATMVSLGLTGVHEAGVTPSEISIYKELIDKDQFIVRDYAMLSSCELDYCGDNQMLFNYGANHGRGGFLTVRSVKLYLDGALGSWGAALIEPYSDKNTSGLLQISPANLTKIVEEWMFKGWQLCTHAIGDRANQLIIDSYEAAMRKDEARGGPGRQLRHRIEHTQIIKPEDVIRMGQLQIIPSMQPTHATSDMRWAPDRLGPNRTADEAYPWSSALNSTGIIALGSDFPVEGVDPLLGIYAAVTRQNATGWPAGGWLPYFRLSRQQTLKGFTLDAAYAAFEETQLGSIAAGKWADFVVFDQNIMDETADPKNILNAKVLYTYVGGKIVYQAPKSSSSRKPSPQEL